MAINRNEFLSPRNLRWAGRLFALLFLAFGVAFSWQSWRAEKAEDIQHLSAISQLGSRARDSYFSQFERALELLSRDLLDEDGELDAHRAQFLLKRFIGVHAELPDMALVGLDGQVLLTAKSAPGAALPYVGDVPSFILTREELLSGEKLSIARPLIGRVVKQWVIPLRYGVRNDRGNLRFIINTGLPLSKPQSFWKSAPLPEGTAAGLRRDDDYVVSRYPIPDDLIAWESERKTAHDRELQTEKALRATLVREVHHRVKNALQGAILLMDTSRQAQPEISIAIESAIARLYAMATIFGLQAPEEDQHVFLCKLAPEICGSLAKMMGCSIEPVIETDLVRPVQIADDETVPVALVINELVFNAIKHGRPGEPVKVFLSSDGESASVRVVTAGAVLPPGFDFESGAGTGTGLQLVKSMLPEDSARVAITSGPEGVSAELVLRPPVVKMTI